MTVALALAAVGMFTPYLLRQFDGRRTPGLMVAAHLAGLTLVWIGVVDALVGSAGLAHSIAAFCGLAHWLWSAGLTRPRVGCCQRSSASALWTRPVAISTMGW